MLLNNESWYPMMMKHYRSLITAFTLMASLSACNSLLSIPIDESYTLEKRFAQDVQHYPFIQLASAQVPDTVMETRNITYVRYGARELQLDLYQPRRMPDTASSQAVPGILLIHGGGWRSGVRTHLKPLAIELANAGFVAATVSYRLSPEARYPAAIHDVKAAIRWLRTHAAHYGVDPSRIAVGGTSAGGQIASLTGMTNGLTRFDPQAATSAISSDVQLIVNVDGLSDFTSTAARQYEDPPEKSDTSAGRWFGGNYLQQRDRWHEASPTYYVGEQSPPILFLNSAQERFHVGRDEMVKKMAIYHIPTRVVTLPDTPHTFWLYEPWLTPSARIIVDFIKEHLGE